MKRTLSFLFGLLLLAIPVEAGAATLRGDVNGDGTVTIADVTVLIDYLLTGDEAAINLENADVSGDGLIGINDVTKLIDYLLIGSWEPYAPQTETFTVNGVSFTMVIVEGGTFMMGSNEEEQNPPIETPNEYPVHEVTLSNYGIGQTEVTQELWEAVMSWHPDTLNEDFEAEFIHPSYFSSKNGYPDNLQRPVENVSTRKIELFLGNLQALTGREFRLPTDAEWEFAARGGNQSRGYKYSGSDDLDEVAWWGCNFNGNSGQCTNPVATKAPNELGLYDMSGNVWECTADRASYEYPSEPETNPSYPIVLGSGHSARGGCWAHRAWDCRVSRRFWFPSPYSSNTHGLRLALTL